MGNLFLNFLYGIIEGVHLLDLMGADNAPLEHMIYYCKLVRLVENLPLCTRTGNQRFGNFGENVQCPKGWFEKLAWKEPALYGELAPDLKNAAKRDMSSAVCASSMCKSLAPTPIHM